MSIFLIKTLFIVFTLASCLIPLTAHAESKVFYAPEGNVSSLMVFERGGFARGYGIFSNAAARMLFDEQTKALDNLKFAVLLKSFTGSTALLRQEMSARPLRSQEAEIAFVQDAPVKFENGKAIIKGQFIINNVRKDGEFEATLNKFARVSKSSDIFEDGTQNLGLSLHAKFKRSDFGLSVDEGGQYNDEAVLMLDIVAAN